MIKPVRGIKGEIRLAGDKSISHRAVMLACLARGTTRIKGLLEGEDCLNTVRAFKSLGVRIEKEEDRLIVHGQGLKGLKKPSEILDAGNSGTTMRLLLGILAGQNFTSIITGDESLRKRPMKRVILPLSQMGARFEGDYAPVTVYGNPRLLAINYHSPIASAQVKSSILLAGLFANGVTSVTEPVLSRDHTERMLPFFGVEIEREGLTVKLKGPATLIGGRTIQVPADISSASFFIVAALILPNSKITLPNVGLNPTRTGLLDTLKKMGAKIRIKNLKEVGAEPVGDIEVASSRLKGVEVGKGDIPRLIDEVPILAVACAMAEGKSQIRGAEELRVKECDRLSAAASELSKMGAKIKELEDGLIIEGGNLLKGAEVESFFDHRIAMSLAVAGLAARGETTIKESECINTSFPDFMPILERSLISLP